MKHSANSATIPAAASLLEAAAVPGCDPCDVACAAMPGLVLGELTPPDRTWLETHTLTCRSCDNELTSFRRVDDALVSAGLEVGETTPPPLKLPHARRAGYGRMESPIGPIMIATTDTGVCEIGFGDHETEGEFLQHLRNRGFRPVPDDNAIASTAQELKEYFGGERGSFDLQYDFTGISPFTRLVLEATRKIPFGHLSSYRGIAEQIGHPSATRAVGNALGRNPIPVVIPCHRIVRSDHSIGGYTGGLKIKHHLLTLEGVMLPSP
jgi:methylated-DNA-[protein]-cysteine S-methyltransferase